MPGMYSMKQEAERQSMAAQGTMLVAPKLAWFAALASWVASVLAFPFEAIMRHDFGERYFSLGNAVFSVLFVALPLGTVLSGGGMVITVYVGLAVIASVYHLFVIWRRRRRGETWYSYYDGTPWLAHLVHRVWPMSEATVQRFVEPAAGLLVVLVILPFFGVSAGTAYVAVSIAGAVAGTNLRLKQQRHQWLDMIDGQLTTRYMADAARGQPARQTQGVTIAEENVQLIRQLTQDEEMRRGVPLKLRAAVSELTPEEQAMLDEVDAEPPPSPASIEAFAESAVDGRGSGPAEDPFAMLDEMPGEEKPETKQP